MPKKIAILGSTGSIGVNTLDIVRNSKNRFKVSGLAAGGNIALLEKQIREFKPKYAALFDEKKNKPLENPRDSLNISPDEILNLFGDNKEKE